MSTNNIPSFNHIPLQPSAQFPTGSNYQGSYIAAPSFPMGTAGPYHYSTTPNWGPTGTSYGTASMPSNWAGNSFMGMSTTGFDSDSKNTTKIKSVRSIDEPFEPSCEQ